MRISVLGAGPAGLYLAILLARSGAGHEITVVERNPPDATFGWGVVFSEETLGALRDADYPTYLEITDTFARWDTVDISFAGRLLRCRGHGFSAIARTRLLDILQRRCADLGVELRFGTEVGDPAELDGDLVVGADGVHSVVRRGAEEVFGTSVVLQGCKYVWYGTDLVFDAFRFIFVPTEHGMFQVHAYPFDEHSSTFIVEAPEDTWRRAGLAEMTEEESIAYCERLFAADLAGHRLLSNRSTWLSFPRVRNRTWHHGNVVLLGDAAHTAHFTIGSGTKLAMEDAVALANAVVRHGHTPDAVARALVEYESERQPVVERFQRAAAESAGYFARVGRHGHLPPYQFATNLLTRSGRISHANLTVRDPDFVRGADAAFAGAPQFAPPPMFVPLRLGNVEIGNRVVRTAHTPAELTAAAGGGAGLVLAGPVAVSKEGRTSPEASTMDDEWAAAVAAAHGAGARAGVRLAHAGRRGAVRPARSGVDVPLPADQAWPLVSASALPYGPGTAVPREASAADLDRVRADFAAAAARAASAGFDVLVLDCAHGGLLASFLSPLANHRTDEFGGPLENRLRFPLSVLAAVRGACPVTAVRLSVTDWAPGGVSTDEGVRIAAELAAGGADLVHVEAGQTVAECRPVYRRGFLTTLSDRVRTEAGVPTLVGGYLTTPDQVNTVVAAGRADLCLVDFPEEGS
ncbi:anthraniloyl-CoA monooxygenase [Amycolatopsis arida]|uniref:Anthraniloyl-CoA monooxygenase n=1 Tax=Amycolatopsis arida TaxID=587909 RepID=A0A1I5P6A5_9PSEU|nr:FAD-dependent monooxygenase [Amycolatopsis arida]TDX98357.1 anthraniloyl-CoA monooxygenase [Amycolatopsis arida]SFP29006.1 anthraniloyl-CoA monooxygenase [Amycolatopsis arida]